MPAEDKNNSKDRTRRLKNKKPDVTKEEGKKSSLVVINSIRHSDPTNRE